MRFPYLLAASLALAATTSASAKDLTLERLFQSPSLSGPTPRLLKISPDGQVATLLRNRPDDRDRFDLWAVDARTGQSRMLIDSLKLGSGAEVSKKRRCGASGCASPAPRASPTIIGRRTPAPCSCRWMGTCIWPGWTAMSAG
jgi:hypothetical protein